jgi:hypothetical protein
MPLKNITVYGRHTSIYQLMFASWSFSLPSQHPSEMERGKKLKRKAMNKCKI